MSTVNSVLYTAVCVALAASAASADVDPRTMPLEDGATLAPQSVQRDAPVELTLPALPARPGKVIVLRFRAVIVAGQEAGCNYSASALLNGSALGRHMAGGDERLIGREAAVELAARGYAPFPVFSGDRLMIMFAPDADRGDAMTTDGLGATFVLNVSDVAHGVDGNALTLRNENPAKADGEIGLLRVEDIEVGWADRASLPEPPNDVPERGPVARSVSSGELRLAQSDRGGFVVASGDGPELLIETGIGMAPDAPSVLLADDGAPAAEGVEVIAEQVGRAGYRLTATWSDLSMTRTVAIRDGLVEWKERWANTGESIRGIPFRHRLFLRSQVARFRVGGSADNSVLAGSAPNPTLFLESPDQRGNGWGIAAESDWLRLLMGIRTRAGVGEILSETLALAPKASVDFDLTITPVSDGGYWSFISSVRERWGVNGVTQERPIFWSYARAEADTPEERTEESLAHLGPIHVVIGPWQRLEPDARIVRGGKYPKLPPDAPRAPGACPDFDVDAFLTFAHREAYWTQLGRDVELIRKAAPNARIMQMAHPAMEAVYRPLKDRWPMHAEAILAADGEVFEAPHYSRAWLYDWADKDWGVLYYAPRPGSAYLEMIMDGVIRALDEVGLDGIYCDEFSWAGTRRGYNRYDYSRWDGHSADLDENGNVLRLKSDNGFVTESCQLRMVGETLRRGKFFLGNGGNALRSLNSLPHARFIEGGNGPATWCQGHLSPAPLVLGNMGDRSTREGVFASVKACLRQGCLYSPSAVNLVLEGSDNFVCKLYPITVRELGPGWIVGEERLITTIARGFDWPNRDASVRLYRYDAAGALLDDDAAVDVQPEQELTLDVPENGLVIAELG